MNRLYRLLSFVCVATLPISVVAQTFDPVSVRGAVVLVVAKGIAPSLGNAEIAIQGTGFFTSRDGLLVTSLHLRNQLGDVAPESITYEVHFSQIDIVPASPMYVAPPADLMVLYAPVGDRNIKPLEWTDRTNVVPGVTDIFTAGYPGGYQLSYDRGVVRSFAGPIEPVPLWSTNFGFKNGQSGSPILLANGRVMAVVKGSDDKAPTIGLVVSSRFIPSNFWDNLSSIAANASPGVNAPAEADRIIVKASIAQTKPARREYKLNLTNAPCQDSPVPKLTHVDVTPGWRLDPKSIALQDTISIGARQTIANITPQGFDVVIMLKNLGGCANVFGASITADITARYLGIVRYSEIPMAGTMESITLSDISTAGAVQAPLPSQVPNSAITYSIRSKTGVERMINAQSGDISTSNGVKTLDTGRILQRIF